MSETKIINLSDLTPAPTVKIIDTTGTEHKLAPISVGTFIQNVKSVEELGMSASVSQEIELMIKIILRGFPTLTEDELMKWPIETLEQISQYARGQNGEIVTDNPEDATAEKSQMET